MFTKHVQYKWKKLQITFQLLKSVMFILHMEISNCNKKYVVERWFHSTICTIFCFIYRIYYSEFLRNQGRFMESLKNIENAFGVVPPTRRLRAKYTRTPIFHIFKFSGFPSTLCWGSSQLPPPSRVSSYWNCNFQTPAVHRAKLLLLLLFWVA